MQAEMTNGELLLHRMISQSIQVISGVIPRRSRSVLFRFASICQKTKLTHNDLFQKEFEIQKRVVNFTRKCLTGAPNHKSQYSGFLEAKQGPVGNHNKVHIIFVAEW